MTWVSTPKPVEIAGSVLSVAVVPAACLVIPDSDFKNMNVNWLFGLIFLLPATFVAGLFSSWLYYRKHAFNLMDPFYIRALCGIIGGLIAWTTCLLLRPLAADYASVIFFFGLGPVVAFRVYRRLSKPADSYTPYR